MKQELNHAWGYHAPDYTGKVGAGQGPQSSSGKQHVSFHILTSVCDLGSVYTASGMQDNNS